MKKLFMFAMAASLLASCNNDDATANSSFSMIAPAADYTGYPTAVTTVSGEINVNTTWDNDHVWEISGVVRVTSGATLTIEPGTYIKADPNHAAPTGVLVITKTGKINALGGIDANNNGRIDDNETKSPIIFTSYRLLSSSITSAPQPGDFGGVVLLGDAPVNTGLTTNVIEGLDGELPAADFQYGGTNASHDAGSFQYVRIEYAGRELETDVEINGFTAGGVGDGGLTPANTKIHHIQVTYGLDDAFEFFGGNVDASNLVAFAQDDDGLDFDYGYTGSIDYAVVLADTNSSHSGTPPTSPDSNGVELDNGPNNDYTNTPFTRPIVNHLSIVGANTSAAAKSYENGIHVRRNGRITLLNSTVAGYGTDATTSPTTPNTWGIRVESPSLIANSTFSNVGVNSYRTSPFTTPSPITGVTEVTSANFGMSQPFFNAGSLNFSGATNGAFVNGTTWLDNWTKFNAF